jgi:hypothetical protein
MGRALLISAAEDGRKTQLGVSRQVSDQMERDWFWNWVVPAAKSLSGKVKVSIAHALLAATVALGLCDGIRVEAETKRGLKSARMKIRLNAIVEVIAEVPI